MRLRRRITEAQHAARAERAAQYLDQYHVAENEYASNSDGAYLAIAITGHEAPVYDGLGNRIPDASAARWPTLELAASWLSLRANNHGQWPATVIDLDTDAHYTPTTGYVVTLEPGRMRGGEIDC